MGFKARKSGTPRVQSMTIVKEAATEAIEGAVCYLQEQVKNKIVLTDAQALTAVRTAAKNTKQLWG